MYYWARSQQMEARKFTDAGGRQVDIAQVQEAVASFVDAAVYDQLLVYFAGHGINQNYSEYWLLSAAPRNAQAAVNVHGSALQAGFCGIPHVVLISDACRTFAESRQMHGITGSLLFPNEPRPGKEKPVDLFYACTLGRAAFEVQMPDQVPDRFSAVYTKVLLGALRGEFDEAVEWQDARRTVGVVRPRPLRKLLDKAVPVALQRAGVAPGTFQEPDAHIVSDGSEFLAELYGGATSPIRGGHPEPKAAPPAATGYTWNRRPQAPARHDKWEHVAARNGEWRYNLRAGRLAVALHEAGTAAEVFAILLGAAMDGDRAYVAAWRLAAELHRPHLDGMLAEAAQLLTRSVPAPAECSFTLHGARLAGALAAGEAVALSGSRVLVPEPARGHIPVLLEFADGRGTLLPALAGHAAVLVMDKEGALVDLDYRPLARAPRQAEEGQARTAVHRLRALAAAATHAGPLRTLPADAVRLAGYAHDGARIDPVLALYSVYSDLSPARREHAGRLGQAMRGRFGAGFLDLDMHAHVPGDAPAGGAQVPALLLPFPVRAAGWALMPALGIALPPALAGLERTLVDSPWTLFGPDGVDILRNYLEKEPA
jgi:hypothetical protein